MNPSRRRSTGCLAASCRGTGWFGSAVVLTVVGGEVISRIADSPDIAAARSTYRKGAGGLAVTDEKLA